MESKEIKKENNERKSNVVNNFYGKIGNFIDNHGTINNYAPMNQEASEEKKKEREVKIETVVQALERCKSYLWGQASLATVFCVCRDVFHLQDNASLFERQMELMEISCPPGTIANTIRNNPYMKMSIDKWEKNGAQERVLRLVKVFRKSVESLQLEEIPT